jgi:hypothetical protein
MPNNPLDIKMCFPLEISDFGFSHTLGRLRLFRSFKLNHCECPLWRKERNSRPYLIGSAWLRDTNPAPRHSLLTPVTSYVRVFSLKEPPVIDGSERQTVSLLLLTRKALSTSFNCVTAITSQNRNYVSCAGGIRFHAKIENPLP